MLISLISLGMLACNSGNVTVDAKTTATTFDMQKAKTFIDSINIKFSEEVKRGDSVALAAHYSDDAEMLFAHEETIKGKGILAAWGGMTRMGIKEMSFVTTDITGSGDLIVETGTYEMKVENNVSVDKGKYVVVWKLVNDEWKLFRDIGNTSMSETAAK